jgi:hypothetical protein
VAREYAEEIAADTIWIVLQQVGHVKQTCLRVLVAMTGVVATVAGFRVMEPAHARLLLTPAMNLNAQVLVLIVSLLLVEVEKKLCSPLKC